MNSKKKKIKNSTVKIWAFGLDFCNSPRWIRDLKTTFVNLSARLSIQLCNNFGNIQKQTRLLTYSVNPKSE